MSRLAITGFLIGGTLAAALAVTLIFLGWFLLIFADQHTPLHDWYGDLSNAVRAILVSFAIGGIAGGVFGKAISLLIGLFRRIKAS